MVKELPSTWQNALIDQARTYMYMYQGHAEAEG